MPTMVLVEDERLERESLISCIDWALIGVQIIGAAANGSQGVALVSELRPDILLTDVRMPVMDGIEMSRQIRAFAPEIKILFLSSYDDFEYARQAIDLNVHAYVMKPANEGELLRTVKKAADEVMERALEQRLYTKIKNNYNISLNLARQALVSRILTGGCVKSEDARSMGLEWLCASCENLCLLLGLYEKNIPHPVDDGLQRLNQECARICPKVIHVVITAGVLVGICASPVPFRQETVDALRAALETFFGRREILPVRILAEYVNGSNRMPADLYSDILRRSAGDLSYTQPADMRHKSRQQIVQEVERIIESQYQTPLTLDSIARQMHFTPNYLGSVYKLVQKHSVNRRLMLVRMEKATELLKGSTLSVNDIAQQCGFGSISYFHTLFKKEKGITPMEYRQNQKETI